MRAGRVKMSSVLASGKHRHGTLFLGLLLTYRLEFAEHRFPLRRQLTGSRRFFFNEIIILGPVAREIE